MGNVAHCGLLVPLPIHQLFLQISLEKLVEIALTKFPVFHLFMPLIYVIFFFTWNTSVTSQVGLVIRAVSATYKYIVGWF